VYAKVCERQKKKNVRSFLLMIMEGRKTDTHYLAFFFIRVCIYTVPYAYISTCSLSDNASHCDGTFHSRSLKWNYDDSLQLKDYRERKQTVMLSIVRILLRDSSYHIDNTNSVTLAVISHFGSCHLRLIFIPAAAIRSWFALCRLNSFE